MRYRAPEEGCRTREAARSRRDEVPAARERPDRAEGFEAATHFYAFSKEHWHRIRSTNGLERLHGEIKRRTRAVGAFPDRASALRLITAVALQVTTRWANSRYLDMTLLKAKEVTSSKAA